MNNSRIALYVGDELYPHQANDPYASIATLQRSPLTSAIMGCVNVYQGALVFNDSFNPLFDATGQYNGNSSWQDIISALRSPAIREIYLCFGTAAVEWLATNTTAATQVLSYIKDNLGFDGIDIDYEGSTYTQSSSPIYPAATAAINAGLKLTAAPYCNMSDWQQWVDTVQNSGGEVSWLNVQCYSGGFANNPGDWTSIGVPIVAGTCPACSSPRCTPAEIENLYQVWVTGAGLPTNQCWGGIPNTGAQTIAGGFFWSYSSVKGPDFSDYMYAMVNGLGS